MAGDEITAASPASIKFAEHTTTTKTAEDESLDLADDAPPPNNRFAFTPAQLHKLCIARSLIALDAFSGLHGLAAGLRTDLNAGLRIDETDLHSTVTFEKAVAAGREYRAPAITPLPTDGKKGHEYGPTFKLDLAELTGAETKGFDCLRCSDQSCGAEGLGVTFPPSYHAKRG